MYDHSKAKDQCIYLNRAIKKYGWKNFEEIILVECEEQFLDRFEQLYIEFFKSQYPTGYNLTNGGQKNSKPCKWVRQRISATKSTHGNVKLKGNSFQVRTSVDGKRVNVGSYSNYSKARRANRLWKMRQIKMKGDTTTSLKKTKKVKAENIKTFETRVFKSLSDCSRALDIKTTLICRVCKGTQKQSKGWTFKYL